MLERANNVHYMCMATELDKRRGLEALVSAIICTEYFNSVWLET